MEKTQTTYDLNAIFTQENAKNCDDKKAFFDENKLKLKTFVSSTGEQYNIVQYQDFIYFQF